MSKAAAGTLHIRPATAADLPGVEAITAASPTAPQWTHVQFLESLAPSASDAIRRTVLIAETGAQTDRRLIGFAVVSALVSVYPIEAELESIAVNPEDRGHGTGAALLAAVEAWTAALEPTGGATLLRLEVRASNAPALGLYQRSGFHVTATRPSYYSNPVEEAVCMERTIRKR